MMRFTQAPRLSISVVVCTRDRAETLGPALDSLAAQRTVLFEVAVVDQSGSDATQKLVEAWSLTDTRFRYLRLPELGLSRAYNAGIRVTSSPILAFTDDGCTAPVGWLEAIQAAFDRRDDVELLCGQVLVAPELEARETRDGFTPAFLIPSRRLLSRRGRLEVAGVGADFVARRTVFARVGLFDEVLGGGGPLESSQDFDFAHWVFRAGRATRLQPDVVVHHYGFRSHADWPATVRSYCIGVGGLHLGVGGFHLKDICAGDLYAARLLLAHLALWSARSLRRWLRARSRAEWTYVGNLIAGMRRSVRFDVDRQWRPYEPRRPAGQEGG